MPTPISVALRRRSFLLLLPRHLHTSPSLNLTHPTFIIWGSNTAVGKTLVSSALASASTTTSSSSFLYLKPLQTGFPSDSDARFLYTKVSQLFRRWSAGSSTSLLASNHVLNLSPAAKNQLTSPGFYEETRVGGGERGEGDLRLVCKTLFAWNEAVSPHLAVEREGMRVEDVLLREAVGKWLGDGLECGGGRGKERVLRVIETAGGVASPGPSGTLQCDLYRPFRLPSILVGDGRLGGISATIAAYECLTLRGYDIVAIVLEDKGLSNEFPLLSYLRNRLPVVVLPPVPEDPQDNLMDWFDESGEAFKSLHGILLSSHTKRIQRLHDMPKKGERIFWWPFTQHKLVPQDIITVIDSRCGENFAIHKVQDNRDVIVPQFDACASWWTQGPDSAMQIELAKDMGYSAARYGHVMFPENVYEPALNCAELLLDGVGKGWASRTYYSDNGSTAIEIALKMAFRKYMVDHEIHVNFDQKSDEHTQLKVLALNGSYHGDTLGAMEAQAPSSYTSFIQQPWYSGRGLFLDPPEIFMSNGIWNLSLPGSLQDNQINTEDMRFGSLAELFSLSRDLSTVAESYSVHMSKQLSKFSAANDFIHIGALIIEPVVQGASGMHMIDPLFQRILVRECRLRKIPVIFDEVFTGFWRIGRESAAELLGCQPDISCFAKLMTGGVIPLAATLTTEAVFEAFTGDSKLMALLHGHSYSAHAMGCTAAARAIQWFKDPSTNPNIDLQRKELKELWDMKIVHAISAIPAVKRVIALGTVFAVELRADDSNTGYASQYASSLVQQLRGDGLYMRPLGNVLYLMCGPCTSPDFSRQQLYKLYKRVCDFSELEFSNSQCNELKAEKQILSAEGP